MSIYVWTADRSVNASLSVLVTSHNVRPAVLVISRNSFLPTHLCPGHPRAVCLDLEIPLAAVHLPLKRTVTVRVAAAGRLR